MALSQPIIAFCKKYARDIGDGTVAIFAGAGLSAQAGFVNWKQLLAPFAAEMNLDIDRESDNLVRFAQYSQNYKSGNRAHLNEALITAFPTLAAPGTNHRILARLPIRTYWTTNYDKLIETALGDARKLADVKHVDSQLPHSKPRRDAVVYKMHGDVDSPQDAVLTRDDYECFQQKRRGFVNALIGDLTGKTFLFVGFSFTDPNLDHILSNIRLRYQTGQREHYCLIRRPQRTDYISDADFHYSEERQRHFVNDLKRYNVTALQIDSYDEVTEVLLLIEKIYRRRTVFISGSAEIFAPWPEREVNDFFRDLGAVLVDNDFRIVSGFGLGVGNSLISGVIERAYAKGPARLDHFLEVRPFPRDIADPGQRARIWEEFRKGLLSMSGIAVFFFGNKIVDGETVLADGVLKEFQVASDQGAALLPVGATGWMAAELAAKILRAEGDVPPTIIEAVRALNLPVERISQLIQPITDAVRAIASD